MNIITPIPLMSVIVTVKKNASDFLIGNLKRMCKISIAG